MITNERRRPDGGPDGVNEKGNLNTNGSSPAPAKLLVNLGGSWLDLARDAVYVEPFHLLPAGTVPTHHRADVPGGNAVHGDRQVPVVRVFDLSRPGAVDGNGFVNVSVAFVAVAHALHVVGAAPGDVQQPLICACGVLHRIDAGIGRHGAEVRPSPCTAPQGVSRAVILPEPHPDPTSVLTADAAAELARWLARDGVVAGWPGETSVERISAAQAANQAGAGWCDVHGDVPATCAEHGCCPCCATWDGWGDCDICDQLADDAEEAEFRALAAERGVCVDEDCQVCESCRRCRCELAAGGRSVCRSCRRCADDADPFEGCHHVWLPAAGVTT